MTLRTRVVPLLVALAGCGGSSAAPSTQPTSSTGVPSASPTPASSSSEPVPSGKDCAKAVAECGGGVCKVAIQNDCDQPVTCDAAAVATCRMSTDMIEAAGRNRDTVAAHTKGEIGVVANCQ